MQFASLFAAAVAACSFASAQSDIPISPALASIIANASNVPQYRYGTQFTQGIVPKNFHSHNDYWRQLPFYSALSVGAMSVEADVWLINGTLNVSCVYIAFVYEMRDCTQSAGP